MSEQYQPIRPETLYGTREFEMARAARMSSPKAPIRRRVVDEATPAPFSSLRGAAAHYGAIRDRLTKAHVREVNVEAPAPGVQATPALSPGYQVWFTPAEEYPSPDQITPPPPAVRDWIVVNGTVPVRSILGATATYYGVSVIDMLSQRRTSDVMKPRQVAMYLAKTLTLRSLPDIGMRMGGRDHTTILHGVRKIEALVATSPALATDIAAITRRIHARAAATVVQMDNDGGPE